MATGSAGNEVYPFSTEDNKSIPLEVIRPISLIRQSVLSAGPSVLTIPVGWKVASFYCSVSCYIEFGAASMPNVLLNNTPYANTLWIPSETIVVATVLEGTARIVNAGTAGVGYLIAQQIQKWGGLAPRRQVTTI